MKHNGFAAIALAIAMTACGGGARENANDTTIGTAGEGVPSGVQRFAEDVASGNSAEIELSRMAEQRASNPEVKQFAEMMIRDHTAAGMDFKQVLGQHNIQAEEAVDEKHRDLSHELSQLNGMKFDREYMETMVDDHQQMADTLEGRANEKANNQPAENAVNQWAAKTLPTVKHHLEMAQQIEKRLDETPRRNTTN